MASTLRREIGVRARLATAVAALALVSCDSGSGTSGQTGHLGVEGASCMRTPDCAEPLQCIQNVCTKLSAEPDTSDTPVFPTDDTAGGGGGPDWPDVPVVHDITTWADVSDWELLDIPKEEAGPKPDTSGLGYDSLYGDCEELGISDSWAGVFFGNIYFDLIDPLDLVYPDSGTMFVMGELSFGITCIESKLVVDGTVDGTATVEEQGEFPFEIDIAGYYSPKAGTLEASMIEGQVTIYGLVKVFFEGNFNGTLQPGGSFQGTWDGAATGTNATGMIDGEATGTGTWTAEPQ